MRREARWITVGHQAGRVSFGGLRWKSSALTAVPVGDPRGRGGPAGIGRGTDAGRGPFSSRLPRSTASTAVERRRPGGQRPPGRRGGWSGRYRKQKVVEFGRQVWWPGPHSRLPGMFVPRILRREWRTGRRARCGLASSARTVLVRESVRRRAVRSGGGRSPGRVANPLC